MKNIRTACLISFSCLLAAPVFGQITGGSCVAGGGQYTLQLSGRAISSTGNFGGSFQGIGMVTADGQGNITMTGTYNTNAVTGKPFTYSGTYTLQSNCSGTITLTSGSSATFTLVVWSNGTQFDIAGSDGTYIYTGSGTSTVPPACATSTLSGPYTFNASGFTLSGTTQNGAADETGVLQFDGQGNVTATFSDSSGGTSPSNISASGTYSVTSSCQATATLTESGAGGKTDTLNFVIESPYGQNALLLAANSAFVRTGAAHSASSNPTQSIANVASGAVNYTPAGSAFVLYGVGLATGETQAATLPLQTTLRATTVTVNGEPAPLYYVNTGQIDAQMPWDIPGGTVAAVVVKNGTATSNATAVYVPATGTPGISVYSNNRAVVVNVDGSVNSGSAAAAVGDEVVAYFTGGGPVQNASAQVTGHAAPSGLSPATAYVSGNYSITVGGQQAVVKYIGLTPGSVGLYQANFIVPQIAKGTYPVVITLAGQSSNSPVMTVSN